MSKRPNCIRRGVVGVALERLLFCVVAWWLMRQVGMILPPGDLDMGDEAWTTDR